ncbi:MAG: nucleotidyltransferase family protein [Verrucomicrobiota bacterium]
MRAPLESGASSPCVSLATPRPEDALLLAAARDVLLLSEPVGTVSSENIDWDYLLTHAALHGLVPCLSRFCAHRLGNVDQPFVNRSAADAQSTAAYNLFLSAELARLVRLLESQNIPVLALKGLALAAAAYPDLTIRQCKDIDLMVAPEQVESATKVLLDAGYQLRHSDEEVGDHTRNFMRDNPFVVLELHHTIGQRAFAFSQEFSELRKDAEHLEIVDTSVAAPSAARLLLILCAHGCKHRWERLTWICDVAALLRARPNLDWDEVTRLARATRSERMLHIGLLLAEALVAVPIPAPIRQRAHADTVAVSMSRMVASWLFLPRNDLRTTLRKRWFLFRMREDFRDWLPLFWYYALWSITPNARDRQAMPLPRALGGLYYLIRPLRLLFKAARKPFFRN